MWDCEFSDKSGSSVINKNFLRSISLVILLYKSKNRESKDYLKERLSSICADAPEETHFVIVEYVPGFALSFSKVNYEEASSP